MRGRAGPQFARNPAFDPARPLQHNDPMPTIDDMEPALQEAVRAAFAAGTALAIRGGGSKRFLTGEIQGTTLALAGHRGIVSYEPTELVITARAGTPLGEIEAALAERNQMLAFEPPHYGPTATLGGTIACNLSGPRRPYAGSARDFVLGTKIINGRGEVLKFGGQVMKNVAGFDVARLMAGSRGTLGVLLAISLKVLPKPAREITLRFETSAEEAIRRMNAWPAGRCRSRRPVTWATACMCACPAPTRACARRTASSAASTMPRAPPSGRNCANTSCCSLPVTRHSGVLPCPRPRHSRICPATGCSTGRRPALVAYLRECHRHPACGRGGWRSCAAIS